jgi:hypothetical protein
MAVSVDQREAFVATPLDNRAHEVRVYSQVARALRQEALYWNRNDLPDKQFQFAAMFRGTRNKKSGFLVSRASE